MRTLKIAVAIAMLAAAARADAGSAEKCASAKMKAASKYAACRLAADSKAKSTGDPADYAKCDEGQAKSWSKAETKYTTDCPTSGDQAAIQADIVAATSCVSTELSGPGSCDTAADFLCGNGVVDAGEVCDQADLDGATCDSATSGAKIFGTIGCAADCKSFETSSCVKCPASGVVVEGQCWLLGNAGESCITTCTAKSMTTSDITLQMKDTTAAKCGYILTKLGGSNGRTDYIVNGPQNVGCYLTSLGSPPKVSTTCTQQGTAGGMMRLCGCE